MWVSRYLENILKSTQDKYHILILFSPGLTYIIKECQCDLIWAVFSTTLNYKPIKILFYVTNYYVRDSVPEQTKYYNFTLHRLSVYNIYSTVF